MLTIVGASGKFDNAAYKVSAGLHGMGAKAVTALSEWTEAEVRRNGRVYKLEFERGYATSEVKDLGPAPDGQTGTTITFKPDPEIFDELTFDYDTLEDRFRELAFLNKGLAIKLTDERDGKEETFQLRGRHRRVRRVPEPRRGRRARADLRRTKTVRRTSRVEVALQYTDRRGRASPLLHQQRLQPRRRHAPVRLPRRPDPGHQRLRQEGGPVQERTSSSNGEDFREGLTAVVSIGHPDPQFESQTKIKLNNPEVEGIVSSVVYEYLAEYLEENPKEAQRI